MEIVAAALALHVITIAGVVRVSRQTWNQCLKFGGVLVRPCNDTLRIEIWRTRAHRKRIGCVEGPVQEIVGERQRLGPHQRAEIAQLTEGQSSEGLAIIVATGTANDPQRSCS